MFLTSPLIEQAIALKFRVLSIQFTCERLSLKVVEAPRPIVAIFARVGGDAAKSESLVLLLESIFPTPREEHTEP